MKTLTIGMAGKIFIEYLTGNGYHKNTIFNNSFCINKFFNFIEQKEKIEDLRDIDQSIIEDYIKYLNDYVSEETENPLSKSTKLARISAVKKLFKALYKNGLILFNLFENFEPKFTGKKKKKKSFSQKEIAEILDNIDIEEDRLSLRDRTICEVMYSSGLRVGEISALNVGDIDFDESMLLIRNSKFNKDRIVPVNDVALIFLKKLISSKKIKDKESPIFIGRNGRLSADAVSLIFHKILIKQNKFKDGYSAHSIRHSTACHLLENGADVRYVQELLGHDSIETTVVYTNMLYESMKKIYRTFHPRENTLYKEVDDEYMEHLNILKKKLEQQKEFNERYKETYRRCNERRKKLNV